MGMENDTRAFLILIVNTLAWVLLWMIANVLVGIYLGYAFFEGSPSWKNILYYVTAIATLLYVARRIWRKWEL
jgi:hypothetical protein